MAQNDFHPDAWTRARNRFVEDLTDEEQRVFSQASPEAILYDASAAEKAHQATSTTRGIVTKLQPFVQAVEQYGAALDVYSNIYPLALAPLWGSVRVVLHLARESWKYFEKITDMFNRISDLMPRLRIYEQLFPDHELLVQSISKVYFDVLEFCLQAKKMFRKAKYAMLTLVWKPFERQFGSYIDAFRRHQAELKKNVSLSHMIESADSRALIRSNQMNIAKERYDQERLSIFASLSSAVDYEAQHRKLRGLRHEGTGTWLIQHPTYIAWKESTSSKGLFIHGIPGSGKTVLTSLIVDVHLQAPTCPTNNTLYFYCDYANPPSLQPIHMYRALLQQLFFRGLLSKSIERSVVETLRLNTNGLSEEKLTDLMSNAVQSCASLHVFLDGLDECEKGVQQELTGFLCRLMNNSHPLIRVLITCREEGHLLTKLENFSRLQITSLASATDMQSYISHAVTSSLSSGDLTLRDPALKEEIISRLISKAQGMFLWVHFQIIELCEAASDEGIRDILENLPEGLYDTYTRIFKKIAISRSKSTVLKIMMWMVCAKRLLRMEELQEAVAFDSHDRSWNANKIPDGDKMIRSCHGLVIRDTGNETVRLAHHTVQLYLLTPQHEPPAIAYQGFGQSTEKNHYWPELYKFNRDPAVADVMAGEICATYLCFSDFGTAISRTQDHKKFDLTATFRDHGPVTIPAALGLGKHLHSLPYRFFGAHSRFKIPDIDYSKYLNVNPQDRRPSADFRIKFALLEYVIEYWPCHIMSLERSSEPGLAMQFWDLVQHQSLAFEFRPWGPNRHFGLNGCKGCPVPDSDDLEAKALPSMGLLHWAAETGHLKVFDILEPPLQKYLRHERYHDTTLLIACRHGQVAVVEILLARGVFDLSNGRAIVAACTSGNVSLLEHLLQAQEARSEPKETSRFSDSQFGKSSHIALYQAASNGHKSIVEFLITRKVQVDVRDTVTGLTPLQIAAKNGHLEVVKVLSALISPSLVHPFGMDTPHEVTGMKALHYAAASGHCEIITLLLQRGWECNDQDLSGETPLIKASKRGQATVAKSLLEWGADPSVKGGEKYDDWYPELFRLPYSRDSERSPKPIAAHHAAANGHANVLDILPYSELTCGDHAVTALHLGAAYGYPDVVRTLLSKGAQIESRDIEGLTALHHASLNGQNPIIQLLLNRGCSVDGRTLGQCTALHFAAWTARSEIIKLLVAHGAAIDAKTWNSGNTNSEWYRAGSTALHLAACYADADTIRALIECGASLEERDLLGLTALEEAVKNNMPANMLTLIALGAEWNKAEVFRSAVMGHNVRMVEILHSRLSMATAKEQQTAAEIISAIVQEELVIRGSEHESKEVYRLFRDWERKWNESGSSMEKR